MKVDSRFLECLFDPADLVEVRLLPKRHYLFSREEGLFKLRPKPQNADADGQDVSIGTNPHKPLLDQVDLLRDWLVGQAVGEAPS